MDKKQRKKFEERLLDERRDALESLAQHDERFKLDESADGDLTNYPLHLADEGTDTMEREKEYLLASKDGQRLYAIDEALQRLYKEPEQFGTCTACGKEIAEERLELIPWAKLCIEDERKAEQG